MSALHRGIEIESRATVCLICTMTDSVWNPLSVNYGSYGMHYTKTGGFVTYFCPSSGYQLMRASLKEL